jgi:hypothetical protein
MVTLEVSLLTVLEVLSSNDIFSIWSERQCGMKLDCEAVRLICPRGCFVLETDEWYQYKVFFLGIPLIKYIVS